MKNTKIELADHTFNPWEGCTAVGPGCDHCYAEARNARFPGGTAINWGPGAPRRRTIAANWAQPLRWNAEAERNGVRKSVFCASLGDWADNSVPVQWRFDLADVIIRTSHLDWLLLTKRIGNAAAMLAEMFPGSIQPNVLIGATITNQAEADRDVPKLLAVPAVKRFLSMEPLLGPVSFEGLFSSDRINDGTNALEVLDWVIVGGESGPNARPMHPDWVRSLRDQCQAAGVPFLFKQWGEWVDADNGPEDDAAYDGKSDCWAHIDGGHHGGEMGVDFFNSYPMYRVGKRAAGRLLDGREWNEVPV